jgi:uncharacterized protein (TIGR02453 family)
MGKNRIRPLTHFHGFPPETIPFLTEIIEHNDKEWFEANKERYIQSILNPTKAYVEEMGEHLQILVPTIHATPKVNHSLFRIYRDARRHPTRPIKERIGMIFWQGAGHRMDSSCFYIHFDTTEVLIATGIRAFKPPLLAAYREHIKDEKNRTKLHEILVDLQTKGYHLPEPRYKRLPREFDSDMSHSYLAKLGGVFVRHHSPLDEFFHSDALIDQHFAHYERLLPLQQWVYTMTHSVSTHD